MRRLLLGFAVAALLAPTLAFAQGAQPAVMLHIDEALGSKVDVCADYVAPATCDGVVVQQPAGANLGYNVYLLTATGGLNSYAGLELSIHFTEDTDAFAMLSWTLCADSEFPGPGWDVDPESGTDNFLTFDPLNNCQPGNAIVVNGYFYVGAYDDAQMGIGPRGASGLLKVADCTSLETILEHEKRSGSIGFGTLPGCNSCLADCAVPVEEATWGSVKALFKGE